MKTKSGKKYRRWLSQSEVFTAWAKQNQPEAKSTNVYFEGKRLYSYGNHYLLGILVNYRGQSVALINDQFYSKTTRGHQSEAFWKAKKSRHVVIETENIADLTKVIQPTLEKQRDRFLELISDFLENGFSNWIIRDVREFNRTCARLGHSELVIDVPREFLQWARELDKVERHADRDWNSREQLLLELLIEDGQHRKSIFPRMTRYYRRNWDKTA